MAVYRYLDLSTCHVTREDMDGLQQAVGDTAAPVIAAYPEGVILYVPDDGYALSDWLSPSLAKILAYARAQDCYLVRLDADGEEIDDPALDRHDW